VFEEESSGDVNYVEEVEFIEKEKLNEVIRNQKIENERLRAQLNYLS
jgi:hypothetical protein